jgi:putative sterol carrier protein
MSTEPIDIDPKDFAAQISQTPDEQLAAGMQSEMRGTILSEIFGRMEQHFRADAAKNIDAVIHFTITDKPGGGEDQYEVVIKDGACSVSDTPTREARTTFTIDPVSFLKLVTGNASGPLLFTTGKLKISGDLPFAAQTAGLFTVPS